MASITTIKPAGGARVLRFPDPPPLERARGTARITFKRTSAKTAIAELYQSGCAKVRLPRPAPGARAEAVLINTAGGLTDGDRVGTTVTWAAGAEAIVTTQAAERIYRSRRAAAELTTCLTVGPDAVAFWLPQETILFDRARLARSTSVDLDSSASLIACESMIFGRAAMGETVTYGAVEDDWRIRVDGRLVFADSYRLNGDLAELLDRPALGAGARALATVLYVGPKAAAQLSALRAIESEPATFASSCRDSLVITRILADDGLRLRLALRRVLATCIGTLDPEAGLPRVWSS